MAAFWDSLRESEKTIKSSLDTTLNLDQQLNQAFEWAKKSVTGWLLDRVKEIEGQVTKTAADRLENLKAIVPNLPSTTPQGKEGAVSAAPVTLSEARAAFNDLTNQASPDEQTRPWYKKIWNKITSLEKITNFFSKTWEGTKDALDKVFSWPPNFTGALGAMATIFSWQSVGDMARNAKETAGKVVEDGKEKIEEFRQTTPEQKLTWAKEMKQNLIKKYHLQLDAKKSAALDRILDDYQKGVVNSTTIKDGDRLLDKPVLVWADSMRFAMALVHEWIIPLDNIAVSIAKESANVLTLSLTSLGDLAWVAASKASDIIGTFSLQELNKKYNELSEWERGVLVGMLYRKSWLIASVLGFAGWLMTDAALVWPTWSERTGLLEKVAGYRTLLQRYDGLVWKEGQHFKPLVELMEKFGDGANGIVFRERYQELITKTLVTDIYAKHGGDTARFMQEMNLLKKQADVVHPKVIDDILAHSNLTGAELRSAIVQTIKNPVTKNFTGLKGWMRDWNRFLPKANPEYLKWARASVEYAQELVHAPMTQMETWLAEMVQSWKVGKIWETWTKLFPSTNILMENGNAAAVIVNKADATKFVNQLKMIATESPSLIKWFFHHLPMISVIWLSAADREHGFLESFGRNLLFMVPLIGPFFLIREGTKIEWNRLVNLTSLGAGVLLMWQDMWWAVKCLRNPAGEKIPSLLRYAARPAEELLTLGTGTVKAIFEWGAAIEAVMKAIQNGERAELLRMARKGLVSIAIIIGLLILAYYGWKKFNSANEFVDQMKKDGLMTSDGQLNVEAVKRKFPEFPSAHQEMLLESMMESVIGSIAIPDDSGKDKGDKIEIDKYNFPNATIRCPYILPAHIKEHIVNMYKEFWVTAKIEYPQSALEKYARQAKDSWLSANEYASALRNMGLKENRVWDFEKIYNELWN